MRELILRASTIVALLMILESCTPAGQPARIKSSTPTINMEVVFDGDMVTVTSDAQQCLVTSEEREVVEVEFKTPTSSRGSSLLEALLGFSVELLGFIEIIGLF